MTSQEEIVFCLGILVDKIATRKLREGTPRKYVTQWAAEEIVGAIEEMIEHVGEERWRDDH